MGRKKRVEKVLAKIDSCCEDLFYCGYPDEAFEIRLRLKQVTDKKSGKHLVRRLLPKRSRIETWRDRVTYCSEADKSFIGYPSMCPYCYLEEYKRVVEHEASREKKI